MWRCILLNKVNFNTQWLDSAQDGRRPATAGSTWRGDLGNLLEEQELADLQFHDNEMRHVLTVSSISSPVGGYDQIDQNLPQIVVQQVKKMVSRKMFYHKTSVLV